MDTEDIASLDQKLFMKNDISEVYQVRQKLAFCVAVKLRSGPDPGANKCIISSPGIDEDCSERPPRIGSGSTVNRTGALRSAESSLVIDQFEDDGVLWADEAARQHGLEEKRPTSLGTTREGRGVD